MQLIHNTQLTKRHVDVKGRRRDNDVSGNECKWLRTNDSEKVDGSYFKQYCKCEYDSRSGADLYERRSVVLESNNSFASMLDGAPTNGVKIKSIEADKTENLVYDPTHPHANEEGYVRYPNIDVTAEMTNVMVAQKMYEANTSVLNANKKMLDKDLEIGRG